MGLELSRQLWQNQNNWNLSGNNLNRYYSKHLSYAHLSCVIFDDVHFWISVWKYLTYAIVVKFLEAMHFLAFLLEVMHFFEVYNFPWRSALLRFNFIINFYLMQCELEQCNIFWDTYITNSNLNQCEFFVCYTTQNKSDLLRFLIIFYIFFRLQYIWKTILMKWNRRLFQF